MDQIRADGVEITTTVIDEKDNVIKHTITINGGQFIPCLQRHANQRGLTQFEIVKRRKPSYTGHTHWLRTIPPYKASQTEYSEKFNDLVQRLTSLGHDDLIIAYILNVSDMTIGFWKQQYPGFREAIRKGKLNYSEQVSMNVIGHKPNEKVRDYGNKPNEMR